MEASDFFGVDQAASVDQHKIPWQLFHHASQRGRTGKDIPVLYMTAYQRSIHLDIHQLVNANPDNLSLIFDGYEFNFHR